MSRCKVVKRCMQQQRYRWMPSVRSCVTCCQRWLSTGSTLLSLRTQSSCSIKWLTGRLAFAILSELCTFRLCLFWGWEVLFPLTHPPGGAKSCLPPPTFPWGPGPSEITSPVPQVGTPGVVFGTPNWRMSVLNFVGVLASPTPSDAFRVGLQRSANPVTTAAATQPPQ